MKKVNNSHKQKKVRKPNKNQKVRCWEVFRCEETECPAYKSRNLKCWLFTGTHCRGAIQGKFLDKIEMCVACRVFKKNLDSTATKATCKTFNRQLNEFRRIIDERDRELENISLELALSLSEAFEALKKISSGDPTVKITETSDIELISKLKHLINLTAEEIGEFVDQSHEIAIDIAEHFDVLHRVSEGNLNARVTGISNIELMESLKNVTNEMIESISREIAERKATEASLRELEAIESSILSAIPHAVVGLKDRKIYFANEAAEKVFGWKPQELIGKSTRILYRNDEEYEEIGRLFYPQLETKRTHIDEYICRREDGTDMLCKISASIIGEELKDKGIVVMYEDITEQKRIEEALKESERKYIDLYQNAPDGYHSLNPDGTILEVNDTWLRMLGYQRDEVLEKKLKDFLTEEAIKIFEKTFPILKEKGSTENIDYHYKKKDGSLLPVIVNATAIYDENGNFIKSRAIVRDNSEKKTYEQQLKHAAEEWRVTFDSMPHGVLLLDNDLSIVRSNIAVCQLFGVPFVDLIGKKCYELISDNQEFYNFCKAIVTTDTQVPDIIEYYDKRLNKHLMTHYTSVTDEEGMTKALILSLIDISDLKDKEKRLTESRDAFLNMLKEIDFSYKELQELYNSLIRSFVNAIDAKSPWTKGHSERVTRYALAIAKEMGMKPKDIEDLRIAALLHDIGKIGTYDVVLDKPGKLTAEEFALIKMHPSRGEQILMPVKQLQELLPIIRHHHERMDGKGYPDGLQGDEIPLLARIIAVADSYDSMTSDRPYRPSPSREYAISELKRCSVTQFDPQAAEAFIRILERSQDLLKVSL